MDCILIIIWIYPIGWFHLADITCVATVFAPFTSPVNETCIVEEDLVTKVVKGTARTARRFWMWAPMAPAPTVPMVLSIMSKL